MTDSPYTGPFRRFINLTFSQDGAVRALVVVIFLAGLACRAAPTLHRIQSESGESDEMIYRALVHQLDNHRGYTLHGHELVAEGYIDPRRYDTPLFFHPPGVVAIFWLFFRMLGNHGFAAVQWLSYALFFWGMLRLAKGVIDPMRPVTAVIVALLAAFTPIMAQVLARVWVDGPLLAIATAGAACFIEGMRKRKRWIFLIGAVFLGYSSFIKMSAVLLLPGLFALGWGMTASDSRRRLLEASLAVCAAVGVFAAIWSFWQWRVTGSFFPDWPGKPSQEMLLRLPYVFHLTVVRPVWCYLVLLPQVLWTLVPALLLAACLWRQPRIRRFAPALLLWIAVIIGAHMLLGEIGYSKVIRYVILISPATILLFALCADEAISVIQSHRCRWALCYLPLILVGLGLEITQGIILPLSPNDLIYPLFGKEGLWHPWQAVYQQSPP